MTTPKIIAALTKGIRPQLYTTMNRRPDLAVKELGKTHSMMQEAALRLREAQLIIEGLGGGDTTFGHIEAARQWAQENKTP